MWHLFVFVVWYQELRDLVLVRLALMPLSPVAVLVFDMEIGVLIPELRN